MIRLGLCLSCDRYFEAQGASARCPSCKETLDYRGLYGSVIAVGQTSQRELARIKKEYFEVDEIVRALDERKAAFIKSAIEQANQFIEQAEAEIGKPLKELRDRRDVLHTKLQQYMENSGKTQMRIRNLLLELKNEVLNAGNRPQYTKVVEELRRLAGLTEEEIQDIVRASYSEPQYGNVMHVTKLPPGRRKSYDAKELDLPKIAEIEQDFKKSSSKDLVINSTEGTFVLTGDFVRKNGLSYMIDLQKNTKNSLRLVDAETRDDGHMLVLIEGPFVHDPNTVKAFIADRTRMGIVDILHPGGNRVAVEVGPVASDAVQRAMGYFSNLDSILDNLLVIDQARSQLAMSLPQLVTGATQMDLGDNVDDLSLKYERQNITEGVPQEGIMSPEGKEDTGSPWKAGCASCKRSITAQNRDPINQNICIWCGLESEARA